MPKRASSSAVSSPTKRTRKTRSAATSNTSAPGHQQPPTPELGDLTLSQLQALPSADLSTHLRANNLGVYGNKAQKAQRLYDHLHEEGDHEEPSESADVQNTLLQKVEAALDKHTRLIDEKLARWTSDRDQQTGTHEEDNISEPSVVHQPSPDLPVVPAPAPHTPRTGTSLQSLPPVPSKLSARILKGEYIDFKELLPENMFASPDAAARSQSPVVTFEISPETTGGNTSWTLETPKNRSKRAVDSFTAWMQAWNTYVAVIVNRFKDRAIPMLSYQSVITNAAAKFPMSRWYDYDKRFRLKLSNDQSIAWDHVHTSLWLECFTGSSSVHVPGPSSATDSQKPLSVKPDRRPCTYCGSILHFPHSCQKAPLSFRTPRQIPPRAPRSPRDQGGPRSTQYSSASPTQKSGWCWQFNNTGECKLGPQCQYFHQCRTCGGQHPAKWCRHGLPT